MSGSRAGSPISALFFVATAPSGPGGHVNVSPKGHADTFAAQRNRRSIDDLPALPMAASDRQAGLG